MIKVVLIVRATAERDRLIEKGIALPIAVVDGKQNPSEAVRGALEGVDVAHVAIFMKDTGAGELGWIKQDALNAVAGKKEVPAYVILNSRDPDGAKLEKGRVNIQNWLASVLFKSAFVAFGYKDSAKFEGFAGIFKFCKIFSNIGEAVQSMLKAIKETEISV
jgi:hypothetical protein